MKYTINVTTRSSKNELSLLPDGSYKARLTASPVDGAANSALIGLLAKELDVALSRIKIVHGHRSRKKIIEVL